MGYEEIDRDSEVPVYVQLAAIFRGMIASGEVPPGRAIPGKRASRQEYGISGETFDKAVGLLRAEGLVRTAPGKGIYVIPRPGRREG